MSTETTQKDTTMASNTETMDPFAKQRDPTNDPFTEQEQNDLSGIAGSDDMAMDSSPTDDRRNSTKEWDASKVPPSQFQKRKGSLYSTPNSRDGHQHGAQDRDKAYFEKLKEKGWHVLKGSKDSK